MKVILFISLILGIIFEGTFVSAPVTLTITTFLIVVDENNASFWAFLAGILLDIFTIRILGGSALFFLAVAAILKRYRKKVYETSFFFQLPFLMIIFSLYSLIFYRKVDPWSLAFLIIASLLVFKGLKSYIANVSKSDRYKIS